jgi:hypothetical protein
MVSSSSLTGFQAYSYYSINFMNSLILFSSHYSSFIATTYSLKFDNSLLVQGVYDVVEDLLSEVLKAESVRCKCANKIKKEF